MQLVHFRHAHGLWRRRGRLLRGALPVGSDPAHDRHVRHAQDAPNSPQAHAFQVQLQRQLPLLIWLGHARPAWVGVAAGQAAVALLAPHQPVFTLRLAAASCTLQGPKLLIALLCSNARLTAMLLNGTAFPSKEYRHRGGSTCAYLLRFNEIPANMVR